MPYAGKTGMKRTRPPKGNQQYRQLWRVVDGAVMDAFRMHPDYLTSAGLRSAQKSVVKRVVGAVLGYAAQAAEGRSGLGRRLNR